MKISHGIRLFESELEALGSLADWASEPGSPVAPLRSVGIAELESLIQTDPRLGLCYIHHRNVMWDDYYADDEWAEIDEDECMAELSRRLCRQSELCALADRVRTLADPVEAPIEEQLAAAKAVLTHARLRLDDAKIFAAATANRASTTGWGVERIAAGLGVNHLTVRRWLGRRP